MINDTYFFISLITFIYMLCTNQNIVALTAFEINPTAQRKYETSLLYMFWHLVQTFTIDTMILVCWPHSVLVRN